MVNITSKLRVESVYKVQNSMSMFTNSIASVAELELIKQQLKKTASFSKTTEVEPYLSQSKSF